MTTCLPTVFAISFSSGNSLLSESTVLSAKYRLKKELQQGVSYFSNVAAYVQVADTANYLFIQSTSSDYYFQADYLVSVGVSFDMIHYTDKRDTMTLLSPKILIDPNNPFNSFNIGLEFIKIGLNL